MRTLWAADFPRVAVHAPWSAKGQRGIFGLSDHPLYTAAKTQGDLVSALELIDEIAQPGVVEDLSNLAYYRSSGARIIIAAPAPDTPRSGNVLAIAYSSWLAQDLGCEVSETIFHEKKISRDRQGAWFRIANLPDFYGEVVYGADYILADDVFTMGGTLAGLKGFIETNGGRVIGTTALASPTDDRQIALDGATLSLLGEKHGSEIDVFCKENLGFSVGCLTQPEAGHILRCKSLDHARTIINRERNSAGLR